MPTATSMWTTVCPCLGLCPRLCHVLQCVEWPIGTVGNYEPVETGESWRDIGLIKFAATLALLELGRDVVFSEMDVFWVRDPLPLMLSEQGAAPAPSRPQWAREQCHWCAHMGGARPPFPPAEAADLQISGHAAHSRVNIGFYFMRATARSVAFMQQLLSMHSHSLFDQTEFDMLLGANCDYSPVNGDVPWEPDARLVLTRDVRATMRAFPNRSALRCLAGRR